MRKPHGACVVVYCIIPQTKERALVVMPYQSMDRETGALTEPEWRFVSGTNKNHLDEMPDTTGIRKLEEETFLTVRKLRYLDKIQVFRHTKYGYVAHLRRCKGKLRDIVLVGKDGDVMGIPELKTVAEVDKFMGPRHPHRWLLNAFKAKMRKPHVH